MIEFSDFKQLPAWSQIDALQKEGIVLGQREHKAWTVTLYSMQQHFVELWQKEGLHVITSFRHDAATFSVAEPYLDQLDLRPLLQP
ncbi:hypothetical protein ACXYMU_10580 [Pontibacter sp. CAU 1760]